MYGDPAVCAGVGVHENTLETEGFPLVGRGGVMVAPAGSPGVFKVTNVAGGGSVADTVKVRLVLL